MFFVVSNKKVIGLKTPHIKKNTSNSKTKSDQTFGTYQCTNAIWSSLLQDHHYYPGMKYGSYKFIFITITTHTVNHSL